MKKVTVNVNIKFIGKAEVVQFAINCLKIQLEDNIRYRRKENNNNINVIEAVTTITK